MVAGETVNAGVTAASAALQTQTGQAYVGQKDDSALKRMTEDRITHLVQEKPIKGRDEFEFEGIVYSKPLELFMRESRKSAVGSGGLRLVPGGTGVGKSSTLQAMARARVGTCPPRFLYVEPKDDGEGCEWYTELKKTLGVDVGPNILAQKLVNVLKNEKVKTSDRFRLNVEGRQPIDPSHSTFSKAPRGILILDGLNPTDFTLEYENGVKHSKEQILEAQTKLGETYSFLKHLANLSSGTGVYVFLTTKDENLTFFLHNTINGGSKCQLSKALMVNEGADYNANTFDITAQESIVLRWSDEALEEFLLLKYPAAQRSLVQRAIQDHRVPRLCCNHLCDTHELVAVQQEEPKPFWAFDPQSTCANCSIS